MSVVRNCFFDLRRLVAAVLFLSLGLFWPLSLVSAGEPSKFLALGAGSPNGTFYPVGAAVCRMVNAGRLEHGFRCLTYETGAALYNIQAIDTGELDLGVTFAGLAQDAYGGTGLFADGAPLRNLRVITSLYQMPAGIIVNGALDISSVKDLAGLRIDKGNFGSGKRTIADSIFGAMAWSDKDFAKVTELSTGEVDKAFCAGEIDAFIEAIATPSAFYDRITKECNGQFVPLTDEIINKTIASSSGLRSMVIPGGTYPHNPEDVKAVSINAVLVTSARVNPAAVYTVARSIFDGYDKYVTLHPALSAMGKEEMVGNAKIIPFHEGALKYYKENNLPCF